MKTLSAQALELAGKATEGPWHVEDLDGISSISDEVIIYSTDYDTTGVRNNEDAVFIAQSRTLVPELARRLERACEALRQAQQSLKYYSNADLDISILEELERPL